MKEQEALLVCKYMWEEIVKELDTNNISAPSIDDMKERYCQTRKLDLTHDCSLCVEVQQRKGFLDCFSCLFIDLWGTNQRIYLQCCGDNSPYWKATDYIDEEEIPEAIQEAQKIVDEAIRQLQWWEDLKSMNLS